MKNCKLCGQTPIIHNESPDESVSSGYYAIECKHCGIKLIKQPSDIILNNYSTIGYSGWEILNQKLNECKKLVEKTWNQIN